MAELDSPKANPSGRGTDMLRVNAVRLRRINHPNGNSIGAGIYTFSMSRIKNSVVDKSRLSGASKLNLRLAAASHRLEERKGLFFKFLHI
jgi:hypothetical protein